MNIETKKDIITNCLKKFHHKNVYYPSRLTWTPMKLCYICDKEYPSTYSVYVDDYTSLYHYGYKFCSKCENIVDIFKNLYEINGHYIPIKKINQEALSDLKFFRVSSNKEIKPYIECNAWINITETPLLKTDSSVHNKMALTTTICWDQKNNNYIHKSIPLQNVIFYNRDIFGYSKKEGVLSPCNEYWDKQIKKSYDIAHIPFWFFICVNRLKINRFDNLIKTLIIEFWKGDLV